jgi:hypothetical protein
MHASTPASPFFNSAPPTSLQQAPAFLPQRAPIHYHGVLLTSQLARMVCPSCKCRGTCVMRIPSLGRVGRCARVRDWLHVMGAQMAQHMRGCAHQAQVHESMVKLQCVLNASLYARIRCLLPFIFFRMLSYNYLETFNTFNIFFHA